MNSISVCHWNANGICQHILELTKFLSQNNIDIMLISETHLTNKNYFRIFGYKFYHTMHPDGKARGGSGVLIKNTISHYQLQDHCEKNLQASSICIISGSARTVFSAIYCPPRFKVTSEQFRKFFDELGPKFLVAGDFNAKHTYWGSRLITPKGRQLFAALGRDLDVVSTGHPTYWPTDIRKVPDLIDFGIIKGLTRANIIATPSYDLSSDHSPVILTLLHFNSTHLMTPTHHFVNWRAYKDIVSNNTSTKTSFRSGTLIDEAINSFNNTLTEAVSKSTRTKKFGSPNLCFQSDIDKLIATKRQARREWQRHRSPLAKHKLTQASKNLKNALSEDKNRSVQNYLESIGPSKENNYSLWKAVNKFKTPITNVPPLRRPNGSWARSDVEKALLFTDHLEKVFQPNPEAIEFQPSIVIPHIVNSPIKLCFEEVKKAIRINSNPKKAPGQDKITGKMIQQLPDVAILLLTVIFNSILALGYYPKLWKISQIKMIPKPGKDLTQPSSYRPISLLSQLSKIFERILLSHILPLISRNNIIPDHQFGFRKRHGTIEQVHRIAKEINAAFQAKKYCAAVFLDVAQAFDKVWHDGLLHKITLYLPENVHKLLHSYITQRKFQVKINSSTSKETQTQAGVPQGSVLGPLLYLLYTADLPLFNNHLVSTFADDTAILSSHFDHKVASQNLLAHLQILEKWLAKWRIKVNESKSVQVTFTLRKETCPSVRINNIIIPQSNHVKYLGIHLDRRLTWTKHIESKKIQIKLRLSQLQYLINWRSKLSLENKILIYKSIIKPIWTYGFELWSSACASNLIKIQRVQNRILRIITGAPWFIKNKNIHKDLDIPEINDLVHMFQCKYKEKLHHHPNTLAQQLLLNNSTHRLKRNKILM